MRSITKHLFLLLFLFYCSISCSALKHNNTAKPSDNIISFPVVFHITYQSDEEELIPKYWEEYSEIAFSNNNIDLYIDEIIYDNPPSEAYDHDYDFYENKVNDGRIHIFFIDEFYLYGEIRNTNGLHVHINYCRSVILIKRDTDKLTIAHEIGHFFGLEHFFDNQLNIMSSPFFGRKKDAYFLKWQIDKIIKDIYQREMLCYFPN